MKVNITLDGKVEWLVMFLVLDTNDLKNDIDSFFEGIKNTKLKKSTKIYLLKDTVQRIQKADKFAQFSLEITEMVYSESPGYNDT